jgi:hypothetical protein
MYREGIQMEEARAYVKRRTRKFFGQWEGKEQIMLVAGAKRRM